VLRHTGFAATAGELNICPNIRAALVRARQIHEADAHAARPIAG
jgi:hypothetical protein